MKRAALVLLSCSCASQPSPADIPSSAAAVPSSSATGPAAPSSSAAGLAGSPFDEAARAARACGASKTCVVANVGRCGAWRFTDEVRSFYETTRYFDAAGRLVSTCTGNIEHGGGSCVGDRPACKLEVEQQHGTAR